MLIACYNVYNENKHLPESVKSVYDHVQKIVFVDGRYKGFYNDKPVASDDGMLQWIKDKSNDPDGKFHLIKAPKRPWRNQAAKRSAYLIGKEGDAYLIVDGHDVVTEWRKINLLMGEIGFARVDQPEEDPPMSVKVPRLFAHKPGIKYVTHSYLEYGDNEFFNLGWDHQTLGDMKGFWQRVHVETCSVTIKHLGKQKKGSKQRLEQVEDERSTIEVFDHAKGLNFKGDSHKTVDRVTEKLHKVWVKDALLAGEIPPTYAESRVIVADFAVDWEKKQRILMRDKKYIKTKLVCEHPNCGFISTNKSMMAAHMQEHRR